MRILEICVDLDGGGIDRYLLNYCSRISDIQFDFVVVDNKKIGILENPLYALGCNIYRVPRQSKGIKEYYKALKKIMLENKYDAVHCHLGYRGAVALYCAKKCGIKTRITHAHIAYEPENCRLKLRRKLFTFLTKLLSTELAACGVDAAKWLWGEGLYKKGKVIIHNNAIEVKKFGFSDSNRIEKRRELGIGDDVFAVGHVGRLCDQKNQIRLLDIFVQINKINPASQLFLVGRGEKEKAILEKAQLLSIEDKVHFLGIRDDVAQLLSAFDVFVFPSTHEGLPFTLIETQCNGLYALSADTVTPLVKVSECVEFISLDESDKIWADKAFRLGEKGHNKSAVYDVIKAGYDIETQASELKKYYFNCVKAKE
ncbi:MAG: glycosyltransferase family 1 protein [Ruminococcaceae bacterium]|nr:glycosyltransferase family 1 protein [Oscillospiraceae bacterium]